VLDLDEAPRFEYPDRVVDTGSRDLGDLADLLRGPAREPRQCDEALRLVLLESELLEQFVRLFYDAVDELRSMGLVDVQQSSPKQFWPVSVETTTRRFDREYTRTVDRLSEAVDDLESASRTEEQRGVRTVTGQDVVTDRVIEFIEGATDEVVYMTVEDLLTDGIADRLGAAGRRGVSIELAGIEAAETD
jgi:hypothetical protein